MDKEQTIIEEFVDYLQPELTAYESSLYLFLLRNSFLRNGGGEIRIGKRTIIAEKFYKSKRGSTSYTHISRMLASLEQKGCIKIGDADRLGTLYTVVLPKDIPLVAAKIAYEKPNYEEEDYFTNPEKRKVVFEQDKWVCQYCGEKVTQQNATLDHFVPQSKGGKHTKDNLRTSCLMCNSIKSGKTYEEAAPLLLKSVQERRARGK